jgi:hypothetical protein
MKKVIFLFFNLFFEDAKKFLYNYNTITQLKSLINDIVDGKEIPDSMAKSEGKKVVNDTKVKAEKLLEDVEKMMSQIKSKP